MNVINCRTPYSISVDETGQVGVKIEVYVWNNPNTQPATPTRIFEKKVLSSSSSELNFNISSVISGYINQTYPLIQTTPTNEFTTMWCNVLVDKFVDYGSGWVFLETFEAVSVYGYNDYADGYNFITTSFFKALTDSDQIIYYDLNKDIPYINFLVDHTGSDIKAKYETPTGGARYYDITTSAMTHGIYNIRIPIVHMSPPVAWEQCKLTIYNVVTTEIYYIYNSVNVCEPKYEPINVSFVNKLGGWQFLTFFKASSSSMSSKGTDYNLLDKYIYNTYRGQFKRFNLNGTEKIKCNTGWVDENYKEIIKQLLLSETILLEGQPVKVVTQDMDLKTHLNERNINYQIEFEYAFNLVNNVV
jgi:hypothetical protein